MQVILFKNIEKLGMQGDVVNVAPGFFRNYLGPQGMAVQATAATLKRLDVKRKRLKAEAEKQITQAEGQARQLAQAQLKFVMKSPDGKKLFGSIHDSQIHEQLVAQGFNLERRQVLLREPIKTVGTHVARIRLIGSVEAHVNVVVEAERVAETPAAPPAEAARQADEQTPQTES